MLSEGEIAKRLSEVQGRIDAAARRSRRDPDSVCLVLASKAQPPEAIRAAYRAGARVFGENYVQEAIAKKNATADLGDIRWHLIGSLQTNKARQACKIFELIHSLDSARLAEALARVRPIPQVRVLVEVNLAGESSKHGVAPGDVELLLAQVRDKVKVEGLMTIPPPNLPQERTRLYFARLREMRDSLAARTGLSLHELSMGMTEDYEIAIEEGATIVRVGRAVFGERTR
jgi:pyridoxal phosphate enzyme (YggS family)